MKRRDLTRHLEQHGCSLDRQGSRHSIYHNPQNKRSVAVPRHREIKETTARTICEQIGIPRPEYQRTGDQVTRGTRLPNRE